MTKKVYRITWQKYLKEPQSIWEVLDNSKSNLIGTTAVKTHFGEPGNENAFRGPIIKPIIDWIIKNKISGFLTDTNTLYTGFRSDKKNHLRTAKKHGFGSLGIPVKIDSEEYPEFKLSDLKNQYKGLPIRLGKALMEAESMICISHFKGHPMFGFGGALKNLGMGGAVPEGKRILHANFAGRINRDICVACTKCLQNCPVKAIFVKDKQVMIDKHKCIGCGECVTVCPNRAVEVSDKNISICQEKTAVYAYGLVKNKPGVYINFLININALCDCASQTSPVLMKNLGILISDDPVALDQASVDWINEIHGSDIFLEISGESGKHILQTAEDIGLGSRKYKVIE